MIYRLADTVICVCSWPYLIQWINDLLHSELGDGIVMIEVYRSSEGDVWWRWRIELQTICNGPSDSANFVNVLVLGGRTYLYDLHILVYF